MDTSYAQTDQRCSITVSPDPATVVPKFLFAWHKLVDRFALFAAFCTHKSDIPISLKFGFKESDAASRVDGDFTIENPDGVFVREWRMLHEYPRLYPFYATEIPHLTSWVVPQGMYSSVTDHAVRIPMQLMRAPMVA